MQFLLHAPSSVGEALIRHEHKIHAAPEGDLFAAARQNQWEIITTDSAIALAPFDRRERFKGSIVYLQLTGTDEELAAAIDRLFERFPRLNPGRLYTVTASRVKVRQLPTTKGARKEPANEPAPVEEASSDEGSADEVEL